MRAGESAEDYFLRVRDAAQQRKASPATPEDDLDGLTLLEAMGTHFHEHHEAIMRWSWKLFCAKWCRLIKWSFEEAERKADEDRKRGFEELRAKHEAMVRG